MRANQMDVHRTKAACAKVFPASILPLQLLLLSCQQSGVLNFRNHLSLIQSVIKEPECRYSFNNYHNGKPLPLCSAIYLTVSAASSAAWLVALVSCRAAFLALVIVIYLMLCGFARSRTCGEKLVQVAQLSSAYLSMESILVNHLIAYHHPMHASVRAGSKALLLLLLLVINLDLDLMRWWREDPEAARPVDNSEGHKV